MDGGGRFTRRGMLRLAVPAVAALLVGCAAAPSGQPLGGGQPSGGSAPGSDQPRDGAGVAAPPSGDPQAALATWRSFPIGAATRPLVLTGSPVLDPPGGFSTGEQKLAYVQGQFTLASTLPTAPSTADGFAIVTARQALEQLRQAADGGGSVKVAPLRVVGAALIRAAFGTDRGSRLLPAWRFTLQGVSGTVQVLAIAPSQLWPAKPSAQQSTGTASIAADDQTVSYRFYGSPAGPSPCGAEYAAKATESATAAVLSVAVVKPNPAGSSSDQACPAIAAQRTVTVRLAAPLGDRVLVDIQGLPIPRS